MKIFKTLMILSGMMLLFSACETEVIDPAGPRDEAVVPGIKNLNPATYADNDLENTFIQFDLTMPGSGVDEALLLVSFDKGKERKEVTSVSSFPANIKVPLTEVVAVLGMDLEEIEAADQFSFEIQTIQGGNSYFSSAAFKVAVVCGYEVENVTGDYTAYSSPGEWDMEGNVTLEADPDDEYTIYVHGYATAEGLEEIAPLVLKINPLDFSVDVPMVTIADEAFGYTGYTYAGSGTLNTCNGKYELMMGITVDQGSFGSFQFEFTKL